MLELGDLGDINGGGGIGGKFLDFWPQATRTFFSHRLIHNNTDYVHSTMSRTPFPRIRLFDGSDSLHKVIVCWKSRRRCRQR